jgi:tRNA G10  N-methylase Trm11
MGGEIDMSGVKQLKLNADRAALFYSPIANICWNAQYLPLRSSTVDVFVVDMPFGMSCKLKKKECFRILNELGRVLVPGGRAVLLYQGRKTLREAVKRTKGVLTMGEVRPVNIGGLIIGLHTVWKGAVPGVEVRVGEEVEVEVEENSKRMRLE